MGELLNVGSVFKLRMRKREKERRSASWSKFNAGLAKWSLILNQRGWREEEIKRASQRSEEERVAGGRSIDSGDKK